MELGSFEYQSKWFDERGLHDQNEHTSISSIALDNWHNQRIVCEEGKKTKFKNLILKKNCTYISCII